MLVNRTCARPKKPGVADGRYNGEAYLGQADFQEAKASRDATFVDDV